MQESSRSTDATQPIPLVQADDAPVVVHHPEPPRPDGAGPDEPAPPASRSRRRGAVIGAAVAGGALAAYLGAAWLNSDTVADGTTVAGVAVGGLSGREAQARLDEAYTKLDGRITLTASGHEQAVRTTDLGLTLDAAAVADRLTGFTLNPARLWRQIAGGGGHEDAQPGLADGTVAEGLEAFGEKSAQAPKNATVVFDGTTPEVRESAEGYEISPDAPQQVRAGWLTGAVEVPVRAKAPEVDTAQAREVLTEQAEPAVSAALTVRVGGTDVELEPEQFAPSLSFAVKDGELTLAVDGKKLRKVVLEQEPGIAKAPVDAGFTVRNGSPEVVPGRDGVSIAAATLAEKVRGPLVLAAADERVAEVPTSAQKPELTTAEAGKLGVKERISTFSTDLTADAGRTENLRIAARTVNGTVVMPGETFSLNEVLGQRTPEKGYNPAPAIHGGRLVQDYGGGVSQMATTLFNNVFFAGLEDVYHKPHSFYISRYPEGREATVNWPTVDLKWKNDTETAVLVEASVGSQVTVSFYGTKYWDITGARGARSNYRAPQTHYNPAAGCVPQSASPGFDVSNTRTFRKPGSSEVVKTETFHAVYNAEDRVICAPEPKAEEPETDEPKIDEPDEPGADRPATGEGDPED
ncbi:VanW family protein [Kineosporia succinea]|uniref:Vancomycin resistance protein YoaR n=1 Tax=Kineosporia succinea TaxID=84632 RepID=A0ABT9NYK2_9ACTN|nr:VanW family protein [Kineosporia succinea]MDP9825501.1 vancomycin resistance protein YoaR [Kineosporia succinea]